MAVKGGRGRGSSRKGKKDKKKKFTVAKKKSHRSSFSLDEVANGGAPEEEEEEGKENIPYPPDSTEGCLWMRAFGENPAHNISLWFRENIVVKWWFDATILCVIVANCIVMMLADPKKEDQFMELQYTFALIFLVEMILKWIALGFWGSYHKEWENGVVKHDETNYVGYFSDAWNCLDFIIVLSSVVLVIDGPNVSSIRVLRTLRPLRSVNKVPALKRLVETILGSVRGLADIMLLFVFVFVIFAILGVQLFKGVLHRRCFDTSVPFDATMDNFHLYADATNDDFCSDVLPSDCTDTDPNCVSSDCASDYPRCLEIADNPEAKVISYDDFPHAMLQIFWIISLEMWVDQMYMVQDAYSMYSWPFFVICTFFVSLFAINLCLAVIEDKQSELYDEYQKEEEEKEEHFDSVSHPLYWKVYDRELLEDWYKTKAKRIQIATTTLSSFERMQNYQDSDILKHRINENVNEGLPGGRSKMDRAQLDPTPEEEQLKMLFEKEFDFEISWKAWSASKPEESEYLQQHGPWVRALHDFVNKQEFETFILVMIVLNTIILAIHWPTMGDDVPGLPDALEIMNYILTWIFFAEMVLKIIGLGWVEYWKENWNRFDFTVVWVSIVEFFILVSVDTEGGALSALRAFRILRVLRLLGRFPSLRVIISGVLAAINDVGWLLLIFCLFLFMFTVLGQSLFGEYWHKAVDPETGLTYSEGQWTFERNFWFSLLAVFQVVTGDAWQSVMVDGVRATSRVACVYFILLLAFGAFVILNIFVAILLSKLNQENEEKWLVEDTLALAHKLRKEQDLTDLEAMKKLVLSLRHYRTFRNFRRKLLAWKDSRDTKKLLGKSFGVLRRDNKFRLACARLVDNVWFGITVDVIIVVNCVFLALEDAKKQGDSVFRITEILFVVLFTVEMFIKMAAHGVFPQPFFADVYWKRLRLSDPDTLDRIDTMCEKIVVDMNDEDPDRVVYRAHEGFVHKVLVSDDGFMVVEFCKTEDYRLVFDHDEFKAAYIIEKDAETNTYKWVRWKYRPHLRRLDVIDVCNSFSLTNHNDNSYMSSKWDRMDGFVVITGLIGLLVPSLSVFRVLRAIRPLRIAIRNRQTRVVMSALFRAIPGMVNTVAFCALFWFIVAIIGVKSFAGALWSCSCAEDAPEACEEALGDVKNRSDCNQEGMLWENIQWSFDNVFSATHTLFTVSTLSGWNDTMYACVNSRGENKQPEDYYNPWAAVYFLLVIMVCSFFTLNLIVSVVLDNFNRIKLEKSGSAFLTEQQALWVKKRRLTSRITLQVQPEFPEEQCCRKWIWEFVDDEKFDLFIVGCILLNTLFMMCEHYNQTDDFTLFLWVMDLLFVTIFCLEAVFKIIAFTFSGYIADDWNKFDFFICIAGVLSLMPFLGGVGLNVLRLLRLGRVLRLIEKAKTLQLMFVTIAYSSPALWNIGTLIFIIFFMFAIIGMSLFGREGCGYMKPGETTEEEADDCADHFNKCNFSNFPLTMSLLYRVGTEDGWTDLYATYQEMLGPKEYQVYIYFMLFFLMGVMVMLNLFIAIILEVFDENKESIEQQELISSVYDWRDQWQKFDKNATGFITAEQFIETLKMALPPAGFGGDSPPESELAEKLMSLHLVTSKTVDAHPMFFNSVFLPQSWQEAANSLVKKWIIKDEEPAESPAATQEPSGVGAEVAGTTGTNTIEMTAKAGEMSDDEGDQPDEQEVTVKDDDRPYLVEYQSAVTAMSVYVLQEEGGLSLPLFVMKEAGEKYLIEWYCDYVASTKGELLSETLNRRRSVQDMKNLETAVNVLGGGNHFYNFKFQPVTLTDEQLKNKPDYSPPSHCESNNPTQLWMKFSTAKSKTRMNPDQIKHQVFAPIMGRKPSREIIDKILVFFRVSNQLLTLQNFAGCLPNDANEATLYNLFYQLEFGPIDTNTQSKGGVTLLGTEEARADNDSDMPIE